MAETTYFGVPPDGMDLTESRTESNNAIGIILFVVAVIAVTLRTIARLRFQNVSLAADDYFMYGGLVRAPILTPDFETPRLRLPPDSSCVSATWRVV